MFRHNGEVPEEKSAAFGIRTMVFDVDKGFLLNGKCLVIVRG